MSGSPLKTVSSVAVFQLEAFVRTNVMATPPKAGRQMDGEKPNDEKRRKTSEAKEYGLSTEVRVNIKDIMLVPKFGKNGNKTNGFGPKSNE